MRKNTAKILFVVFMLLQGTNSIKAAQSLTTAPKGNHLLTTNQRKQSQSTKIKSQLLTKKTENIKKSETTIKNLKLDKRLSILEAPLNLSLPEDPSDIRKSEVYPLRIEDIEKLVEANNPKLEIYRREIEQQKYNLKKSNSSWAPTLDLSANPQYLKAENYNEYSADTTSDQSKTTFSIDLNWTLIDPARSPEIALAKDKYKKAITTYLIELRDIRSEALQAYFMLQKSKEAVRIVHHLS